MSVLALGVTVPAQAIDLGCPPGVTESKIPPTPQKPTSGVSGYLPTPENPTTADPFTDGSDTSIYEAYGLAGLSWTAYDAGCGGPWVADPAAAMDTTLGNLTFRLWPQLVTLAAGSLAGVVYNPTWLGVFDQPLEELSAGLRDAFWTPLAPFALGIAGIVIMWAARRSAFGSALTSGALIIAAIGTVAVATAIPARLGGSADTAITSTTGYINARISGRDVAANDPAVEAIAPFVDEVLYPRWLAGTLGDSDSATARTYGPDLFRASAFTWAEAAEADGNPDRMEELVEQKQQLWTETAEKVKEADPDAYQYMTGHHGYRFLEALAAGLASVVLLFPIAAFLLMVASFVLIRVTVMTAPVWATFALLPSGHGILPGAAALLLAAVVNPVLASVGATLTLRTTALLIAPDAPIPLWLGLLLSVVVCLIAWVALKPFRRVWALFTGNPLKHASQEVKNDTRKFRKGAKQIAGFAVKTKVSSHVLSDDIADEFEERADTRTSSEKFVRPHESPRSPAVPVRADAGLPVMFGGADPFGVEAPVARPRTAPEPERAESTVRPAPVPVAPVVPPPAAAPDPADGLHVFDFTAKPPPQPAPAVQLEADAHPQDGMAPGRPGRLRREEPAADAFVVYDYETDGLRIESHVTPEPETGESGA